MKKIIAFLVIFNTIEVFAEVSTYQRTLINPVLAEIYGPCLKGDLEKFMEKKELEYLPQGYRLNIQNSLTTLILGEDCSLDTADTWNHGSARMKQICSVSYWNSMAPSKMELIKYFNTYFRLNDPESRDKCMGPSEVKAAWDKAYSTALVKSRNIPPRDSCVYYGTPKLFEKDLVDVVESECTKASCRNSKVQFCQSAIRCYQANANFKITEPITGHASSIYSENINGEAVLSRFFQVATCRALKNKCPSAQECLEKNRFQYIQETRADSGPGRAPGRTIPD